MALRLHGSSMNLRGEAVMELPSYVERLLVAGDLDGARALLAQLASIAEPNVRYWALASSIEQGLVASADVPSGARPALLRVLATAVLRELEREPSEPRLLRDAGAIMRELGSLDAAEALFAAAERLLGSADGADEHVADLQVRRRLACGGGAAAGVQRASLGELARRAIALAARARCAEGLRLSLCMIVRDEQEMLPRCLEAVADAVDEIVIVDTGSRDRTIEIARAYGARVIEHAWSGSFAQARNVSLQAASGDWLLILDADEVLVRDDAAALRALTGRTWCEAFALTEINHTGEHDGGTAVVHSALRVLRNRAEYRYEGRVHEQIAHRLPAYLPERVEPADVRIEHYGYLADVRRGREKARRNVALLHMQQAESPESPFLRFNLGCEYAAAGDARAALRELERSWELLQRLPDRDSHRFEPALICRLVRALRACGRPRQALERAEDGLERFPELTDLVFEQALAARALGQDERAIALLERCIEMGDAPRRYTATVGCGSHLALAQLADVHAARGEHAQAIELLERSLDEHPTFIGAVLPYASARLADGAPPDAVLERLQRHLPDPPPAARFLLGTALFEAGASTAGEAQFRAVLERQPHSGRARVALAETLLAQRRYREAAAQASAIAGEDPLAALACRSELFARLAGGETDGLDGALARARAAGMPAHELELFAGWRQLAVAGTTDVAPAPQALQLLETMLEALLRVQDFDAFEVLLGLLERARISERERRELLAQLYLRRGFAASAAQEWMAVCHSQPDAGALLGLARVAVATGMPAEAAELASAALEREPDNEAAAELLASVEGAAVPA